MIANSNRKSEAGITLVAMAVTIVVLMMIAIPCIVNIKTVSETDKFTKLKNDITVLKESISQVYGSDDSADKIGPKYTGNKSFLNIYQGEKNVTKTSKDIVKNPNDNDNYYVINVRKLKKKLSEFGIGLVDLNYGDNNYGIDTTLKELNTTDVYIINEKSRTIYYTAGVNYTSGASKKQYVYYRLPEDFTSIKLGKTPEDKIKTPISNSTAYVGYYADVDDDGTVDGVIFADMAKGNTKSGKWSNDDGDNSIYTIPTKTNLNSYYISQASYTGKFGTNAVISPVDKGNSTHDKDRFYVMALKDIDVIDDSDLSKHIRYSWYYSAVDKMSDYATYTSQDFEKGRENTRKMITKWNAGALQDSSGNYGGYGKQDANEDIEAGSNERKDLWGQIQDKLSDKAGIADRWFVPSKVELAAFGGELEISERRSNTAHYYVNLGLGMFYWSSSQLDISRSWFIDFDEHCIDSEEVSEDICVRLCATF